MIVSTAMYSASNIATATLCSSLRDLKERETALRAERDELAMHIYRAQPIDPRSLAGRIIAKLLTQNPDAYARMLEASRRIAETAPARIAELDEALAGILRVRTEIRRPFLEARMQRTQECKREWAALQSRPSLAERIRAKLRPQAEKLASMNSCLFSDALRRCGFIDAMAALLERVLLREGF